MATCQLSRLFKINLKEDAGPLDLFKTWQNDARNEFNEFLSMTMNVASVSSDGTVTNKTVLMRELNEEGFTFNANTRSRIYENIKAHPQISLCFFWTSKVNDEVQTRQVRIEGIAKQIPNELAREQFRRWSLRSKIRLAFCKQNEEIAWDALKRRHDEFLQAHAHTGGEDIEMPDTTVNYVVIPHRVEYYQSVMDAITIADRVLFRLDANQRWYFVHIEA